MTSSQTEMIHSQAQNLDLASDDEILTTLLSGQIEAAQSISTAMHGIRAGADAMANSIKNDGNIVYAAAGSSGLMALADGLEIPPTFGISNDRIKILRAGGLKDLDTPTGGLEDDAKIATEDASVIQSSDCVICLAASGNTVYPVTIMNLAKSLGAVTIGISNNKPAKLLDGSDIQIYLPTPPEVIAGSTRLGAGTSQKIVLNMMSTLMGIKLGHVMNGLMVNLVANNSKLLKRAENIVMEITGCTRSVANDNLKLTNGKVKEAIMLEFGAKSCEHAKEILEKSGQNLRVAISRLSVG